MFYTYIIQSTTSGILYIGQTNNLQDRLSRHNANRNKWTKNKGPWVLIFSKSFESRAEAMKLETHLKSFKNPQFLLQWIEKQD